jgi:hypothetical protein
MNFKLLIALILTSYFEYSNSVSFQQQFTYKAATALNTAGSYKSISARFYTKCTGVCTQDSACLTSYFNANSKTCYFYNTIPLSSEYVTGSADSLVHVKYSKYKTQLKFNFNL